MAILSMAAALPFIVTFVSMTLSSSSHAHSNPQTLQPSSTSPSTTQLQYHRGPLLTSPLNIYLTWYGAFSPAHKLVVSDFFASFKPTSMAPPRPSVAKWWSTVAAYKDVAGKPASTTINLAAEVSDVPCSLGKSLRRSDLATLVKNAVAKKALPFDPNGVYLVLTAADVAVDRFCMGSCGFHDNILVFPRKRVVIAHVGDPGAQCPGLCAWPFAVPAYGPPGPALASPNGVGVDGVVMNLATVLAGAVTNPAGDGYYQGDRLAPLEAATACAGIFGPGAYPGYPGDLAIDGRSKASFNAYGAGGRRYLLPAIWDPVSGACKVVG